MSPVRPRRRLTRMLAAPLLVLGSAALSLGTLELLLRANVIPNLYYEQNRILGDRGRPRLRVLILGDSFMASLSGADLVDSLYALLAPAGVHILNSATAGAGPVEYVAALRRQGARFRPDVVLLSYYVGNDLLDVGCDGDLDAQLLATRSPALWKRTYVAQFVRERVQARYPGQVLFEGLAPGLRWWVAAVEARRRAAEPAAAPSPGDPSTAQDVDYAAMEAAGVPREDIEAAKAGRLNPWIVSLGVYYPDYFRDALLVRSACAEQAWEDTKRTLDLILDEAAALDAEVLPVIFPHTLQVSRAHYALYRAWKINLNDEMLETERPQQLLREYFRSHGLEPLDLLHPFRGHSEALYWEHDEHLNQLGQRFSAGLIAEALLSRIPGTPRR